MAELTSALNAEEQSAWKVLNRVHANLNAMLDRELSSKHELGIADYEVLSQLSTSRNRSLRMTDLAREVQLSPSGLTRRLDGLVKGGLVERQSSPADGRVFLAVLTDLGAEKYDEMQPNYVAAVREHFFDCLDAGKVAEISAIFDGLAVADMGACGAESKAG